MTASSTRAFRAREWSPIATVRKFGYLSISEKIWQSSCPSLKSLNYTNSYNKIVKIKCTAIVQ